MTQQLSSDGNEPQSHSKEIESFSFTTGISPSPWVPSSSNGADRPLIAQTDLSDGVDGGIEEKTIENSNSSNSVTSEISPSSDANHQSIVSANMIDEGEETSSRSSNESLSIVSAKEGEETVSNEEAVAKDPRIIARKYQLQLSKKAVEENTIVYLGTGCGKTHIAVLVIYELGHLIRKPQKNVCVFLAPTIPLVRQQAAVIEESTDFKVGCYHGHFNRLNNHQEWEKELEKYEVLVMTPQILLRNLSHRIIKMELIALLIFDECHHAQLESSHPYAQIMKEYRRNATKRPRIFGMTASPIVGKGGSDRNNIPKSINSLETLLDSKVYSVDEKEELEGFVAAPKVKCYYYAPTADCNSRRIWREKLEEIKNQCLKSARKKVDDSRTLQNNRKLIQRLHDNLIYCLENLGLWGTVKAIRISIAGDQHESTESMETEDSSTERPLDDQYLSQAAAVLDSDLTRDAIGSDTSSLEALEEPFFSNKLLILIGILTTCRHRPDMKCIIFVNRIVVARTLSYLLEHLKCLEFWKCHFLVGFHSGLKGMSRNAMDTIVQKFRSGELNLLVATSIGEEGLDIQTCCLVIRFDLPQTVASFIQSRGRARMPQSEYAFLVERNNQNEMNLIESFISNEDSMNQEITCRTSGDTFDDSEEEYYEVHSTGASCSAVYSVSLLHEYCSKLPHDEFFSPKPVFNFFDDVEGTICVLTLPSNAPIHEVKSLPQPSKEKAKKTACLKACKELQLHGALTDHLCPGHDDELEDGSTDSDNCEDESPRGELHEMLVPAVLKVPLISPISPIVLHYYFIQCTPVPDDRQYQQFGLFVKTRLPEEAEAMELDLHLAHGRIVKTLLVYSGMINFDENEIMQAVNIQEVFLKIILDREDFYSNFVPLEKSFPSKSSTFYLLLPAGWNEQENRFTVDWKLIYNCLSSPVFKYPTVDVENDLIPTSDSLILADGPASTSDIVNSLVFIPHNKLFFFIDEILTTDADSTFSDKSCSTYVEHYSKKFKIELKYPKQPLLKAKQLFSLRNLLHNRVHEKTEARELKEHFVEIPPELCVLKIIGFSKDIGSSLSLLPSIMHRLENLLVAIELKSVFSASFVEGSEVTVLRVLEAITTEKCLERFSLERLEILGDAFLKYAVGRHLFLLHDSLDEGELTRRRSSSVSNSHLYKLATRSSLQAYIRDEQFDPCQFYALGRPCKVFCEDKETNIHAQQKIGDIKNEGDSKNIKCSKNHHWLHKKTIADVVEALVGAFIVDCGFKAAIAFLKWIGMEVDFEASKYSKICTASKIYLDIPDQIDIKSLENLLGYSFLHKGLLVQAFVHPSYNKHSGGCYQRLEFLGDAVLDYLITSYLYSVYPKLKPGQLTDLRSASVNNVSFATVAVARSFHKYLISDSDSLCEAVKEFVKFSQMHPSRKHSVESPTCPKALGDLVESIIGAILLDSGFNLNLVWGIMLSFLDSIMSFSNLRLNPVRQLQELCQACDMDLDFEDSKRGGIFLVHAHVSRISIHLSSNATHPSKKTAMRKAAGELVLKLKAQGYKGKTKTLEQILKSTKKEEAKLIGFDETPLEAVLLQDASSEAVALIEPVQLEELNMQENSSAVNNHTPKAKTIGKEPFRTPIYDCFRRKPMCAPKEPEKRNGEVSNDSSSSADSQTGGFSYVGSAKSRLFDICVGNYWNPPVFECIKDEGPPHLKSFTFKVTVQIEELSDTIIECFSEPKTKKKAAEEHAAEGALWYLWHQGYAPKAKLGV